MARKAPLANPKVIRPLIELEGDLAHLTDRAWAVTKQTNSPPSLFRYAGAIGRIDRADQGVPTIKVLSVDELRHEMARRGNWVKRDENGVNPIHPPVGVIRNMLATPVPPLPALTHLVHAPEFGPDGTLLVEPGYHAATQAYYAANPALIVPDVPERPSAADLARAVAAIEEPICDFPFVSQADRAHAIAGLLAPFARIFIDGPLPVHVLDKPSPGVGAGLLTDTLLWPAIGAVVPKMVEGGNDDEWRKRITAAHLSGAQILVIDNVRLRLDSAALASALTEQTLTDRLLGHSRMVCVPGHRVWFVTGNNVQASDEIARRMVHIRMDPGIEAPESRTGFRHPDLKRYVAEHRGELVWASLVIIRAWLQAGRPHGRVVLGRFEEWSRVMGGTLDTAGIPGFLGNIAEMKAATDQTSAAWRAFVEKWWAAHQDLPVPVSQLEFLILDDEDLQGELLLGVRGEAGHGFRTRLGQAMVGRRERVIDGKRITAVGYSHGARQWRLVRVK